VYALTANRRRKTYEQMIKVIMNLAADRNKVLSVQKIVSDYEEAWLMAVGNMVSYQILRNAA
jgi:hypothetical protein